MNTRHILLGVGIGAVASSAYFHFLQNGYQEAKLLLIFAFLNFFFLLMLTFTQGSEDESIK